MVDQLNKKSILLSQRFIVIRTVPEIVYFLLASAIIE